MPNPQVEQGGNATVTFASGPNFAASGGLECFDSNGALAEGVSAITVAGTLAVTVSADAGQELGLNYYVDDVAVGRQALFDVVAAGSLAPVVTPVRAAAFRGAMRNISKRRRRREV